jgi:hypothetical protein
MRVAKNRAKDLPVALLEFWLGETTSRREIQCSRCFLLNRRSFLGKRAPKGTEDPPADDPFVTKHGHCEPKPTSEKDCKEVGHGYFWDELSGDDGECNFKTHCVSKESKDGLVERDWVGSLCVIPPKDEGGKSGCDKELDYDWYLATGAVSAACHYKDRCKLEPEVCST